MSQCGSSSAACCGCSICIRYRQAQALQCCTAIQVFINSSCCFNDCSAGALSVGASQPQHCSTHCRVELQSAVSQLDGNRICVGRCCGCLARRDGAHDLGVARHLRDHLSSSNQLTGNPFGYRIKISALTSDAALAALRAATGRMSSLSRAASAISCRTSDRPSRRCWTACSRNHTGWTCSFQLQACCIAPSSVPVLQRMSQLRRLWRSVIAVVTVQEGVRHLSLWQHCHNIDACQAIARSCHCQLQAWSIAT